MASGFLEHAELLVLLAVSSVIMIFSLFVEGGAALRRLDGVPAVECTCLKRCPAQAWA